ncbi:MAG: hypothetical protein IJR06_05280 [Paludibacteraceae bacterium]|nr:hypothetical protein [Paludibacteraceae bacterium]
MRLITKIIITTLLIILYEQCVLSKDNKPFWVDGYFEDITNSYIEVASATGWEISDARKKAYQEIVSRRSFASGTDAQVKIIGGEITLESNHDLIVKSRIIDEYVEQLEPGLYKVYLLVQTAKNPTFQLENVSLSEKYPFSARSFVPGWQQFYKGSKIKGGVIIATESLGVGGIVLSFSMKSSYDKLSVEDPKHIAEYSQKADMWQNIGYGFIAFTAAVYIYNIIDATVAHGRKHIIADRRLTFEPSLSPYGLALSMRYRF